MRRHLLLVAVLLVSVVAGVAPAAGQESVTLTVTVETGSGDTVGGATINATWDGGSRTTTTASNGKAFVDVPRGADVRLGAESDEYIRNTPILVENAQGGDVTVEVAPKGQFTLRVSDTEGAVEDALVTLRRDGETIVEGRTGPDGRYTTPVIEQGNYFVRTFKSGYYRNATRVDVGADTTTNIEMRTGTVNVEFEVLDDHFDPPQTVPDARVQIDTIGTQRTTQGTVTFTLPVNSRYQVSATKDGYTTNASRYFFGTDASTGTKTLTIQRERNLSVDPANERIVVGERLSVTVTNAYGEPVANATVSLDGDQVATTDGDGQARFLIQEAGEHTITAGRNGVTSPGVVVDGVAVDDSTPTASPSATPTASATPGGPQVPLPGFTPVTAVLALLALAGVALLSRR
ncbi:carboxypeptidase-like regulatory domain-containing protein [Halorarius halobius]|uniref:carboxypeptidase-like regulatory domain-containing protein n=1 Tax=Halorarius halobius TaxID=2962671 RepID=UPI0020CC74D1|nr:carboxypeptidase-like regulatory domain-containing protein [Halorarius halobius]